MGRQPRIDEHSDGSVSLRVDVGSHTWRLVKLHADRLGITAPQALHILMLYVESLIRADQFAWLSIDWQDTQRTHRDQHGGLPPSLSGIDLAMLHRSERTKSGFVGVYANGAGFRATGRRSAYLGTYTTAEEAAARRYLHYKQHGLPYGELEIAIDELRKQGEVGTDEALRDIVLETARLTGTSHLYEGGERSDAKLKLLGFGPGGLEDVAAELDALDEAGRP